MCSPTKQTNERRRIKTARLEKNRARKTFKTLAKLKKLGLKNALS